MFLPKKVRRLGLRMALSHLAAEGRIFVVDSMTCNGKTGELQKTLKSFGVEKAIFVDAKLDDKFKRASNNLQKYKYFAVEGLNVFDILKYDTAVLTKESVAAIVERCKAE